MLGVDAMKGFSKWKEESTSHNINNNMLLIGMSANASTEDQNEGFKAGMHFFASKPVDVKVLSLLIQNRKEYFELEKCISMLRTLAMSSEDTGDVYCTQKCNLRSPPLPSLNNESTDINNAQCVQCESDYHRGRLERYVRNVNNIYKVNEYQLSENTKSETYASTIISSNGSSVTVSVQSKNASSDSIVNTLHNCFSWMRSWNKN